LTKSHKIRGGKSHAGPDQLGPSQADRGQADRGQANRGQAGEPKPLVGGVLHDDRGNAVWHWATDTARHAAVSTSALLKRLNVSSLSLEETQDEERRQAAAWASYSASALAGKTAPGKPATGKTAAPAKSATAAKPRIRASWWRRLFQRR
jgi:hypothetical protein